MSDYGPDSSTKPELVTRFLARLIDGILLAVVLYGIVGSILVSAVATGGTAGFGRGGGFLYAFLFAVIGTALQLGYFAFFETRGEPTIGKRVMKLNVTGPTGAPLTLEQSVKRNFFYAIGLLGFIPVLGVLASLASLGAVIWVAISINSSPTGQGVHDELAGGAHVVKTG